MQSGRLSSPEVFDELCDPSSFAEITNPVEDDYRSRGSTVCPNAFCVGIFNIYIYSLISIQYLIMRISSTLFIKKL